MVLVLPMWAVPRSRLSGTPIAARREIRNQRSVQILNSSRESHDGAKAISGRKSPRRRDCPQHAVSPRRLPGWSDRSRRPRPCSDDGPLIPLFCDASERSCRRAVCSTSLLWRIDMTKLGVLGATALSLSLAFAAPALAQQAPHARAGGHAAAGGGGMGRAAMGAGPRAQANFGAQANVGRANFARGGNAQFARGNQFAQRGEFRGDRGRGFGRGAGFAAGAAVAGVATGAAIAAGDYGYGYGPGYYGEDYAYGPDYGDSYAYDTGPTVAFEQPVPVEGPVVGDASYCAQRYRSYDPASGTYLGFDGLRHPCP